MNQTVKRGLALVMAIVMCIGLLPALHITADAASSSYIYNWGTRGETATTLSEYAVAFYEKNGTSYQALSQYHGGTSTSNAPDSKLYAVLNDLMSKNHTHKTTYAETRDLYMYTDCQAGGGSISSFYSGKAIGPKWDGGATWNREHTWPNSKGDASGDGENDIMMLRPTAVLENSTRGNDAFGESSGYFHPNRFAGEDYDLRGDVARIMLYVYTRWGNTGSMWGKTGVIESLDVLLKWMAEDPVDTWELGRNDSVQSITGTRNVFVDYPELAFRLFGAEIPANMTTPSGANAGHTHVYKSVITDPTCTEEGYTTYTCTVEGCNVSYKDNYVATVDHNYVNGVCTVCKQNEPVVSGATLVTDASALKIGDQIIIVASGTDFAMGGPSDNGNFRLTVDITKSGNSVVYGDAVQIITLEAGAVSGTFTFNVGGGYLYAPCDGNNLKTTTSVEGRENNSSWNIAITDGIATIRANTGEETKSLICHNPGSPRFSCYQNLSKYTAPVSIYKIATACSHEWVSVETVEATCIQEGWESFVCSVCKETKTETLPKLEHVWSEYNKYIDSVAPTAEKEGVQARHCENCGKIDFEVLAKVENVPQLFATELAADEGTWKLVTDASTLKVDDEIIIVASTANYALSTTQNKNNRGAAAVTKGADNTTVTFKDGIQIITLKKGDVDGTFAFYVEGNQTGYLYAASSSKNHLKTQSSLNGNASWKIAIDNDGVATIEAKGTNTHNQLKYNPNNGSPLFSCYSSAQQGVSIYKLDSGSGGSGGENPGTHEHAFTQEVAKEQYLASNATCIAKATYFYSCECGEMGKETFEYGELEEHTWGDWTNVDAKRCDMEGYTYTHCSDCGKIDVDILEASDHNFETVTVPPTCTEQGYTVMRCSVCGYEQDKTDFTETVAHTWDDGKVTKEPTCTDKGEAIYTCSVCNNTETRPVDALGHAFGEWTVTTDPTCTEAGEETRSCSVCDATEARPVDALGHKWNDETPKTCEVCGQKYSGIDISEDLEASLPEGVDETKAEEAIDSVISSAGNIQQPEKNGIGAEENEAILEAAKENIKNKVDDPAAIKSYEHVLTITMGKVEVGSEGDKTVVQKITYEVTPVLNALGENGAVLGSAELHEFETVLTFRLPVDKNTTATVALVKHDGELLGAFPIVTDENGNKYVEVQSKSFSTFAVELHTHEYNSVVTPATCTTAGYTTYTCATCGDTYQAGEVPALGHTEVIDEAVKATCTKTGLTEGKHCSVCNVVLVAQKKISAKGHTPVTSPAVAATCTKTGLTEGKYCSACNEVLAAREVVPALGHTEVVEPGNAATCTEPGLTEGKFCSVCNERLAEQTVIPALGHTEVVDVAVMPTCTESGLTSGKHCAVCNAVLVAQTEVAALGHTEVIDPAVAATCNTDGLTAGKHCSVCNMTLEAQSRVPATGHSFGQWSVSKKATTKANGEEIRSCACGATETRVIPMVEGTSPVVIVVIVVVALGAAAAAAYVLLKKRA